MFNTNFGGSSLSIQNKNAIIEPTPEQRNELFKLLIDDPMYYSVELPLILPDTNEDLAEFGAKARRIFKNSNFEKDTDDYSKKELMVQLANNIIGTIREKQLKPKITDAIVGTNAVDGYVDIPVGNSALLPVLNNSANEVFNGVDLTKHRLYKVNANGKRLNNRGIVMNRNQVKAQNKRIRDSLIRSENDIRAGAVPKVDVSTRELRSLYDDPMPRVNVAETSNDFFDGMNA